MIHTSKDYLSTLIDQLTTAQNKYSAQIHCITNFVTANLCANTVLAAKASPIMADAPEESATITAFADALMLNLGTLSESRKSAMLLSYAVAKKNTIPTVIDPVGIGASSFRNETFKQLMAMGAPTVIKGNLSEIHHLVNETYSHGKIDSDKTLELLSIYDQCQIAKSVATCYQSIVVMTGNPDILSDGHQTLLLKNGHPMLKEITGTGCMLSALIASYCAYLPDDYYGAAMLATASLGYSGEVAAQITIEKSSGTGTFEIALRDALSTLDFEHLKKGLQYENYTESFETLSRHR